MSRRISHNRLSDESRKKMAKELQISVKPSKYSQHLPPKIIYPYEVTDDYVYIPFAYTSEYPRPKRSSFPEMTVPFEGKLREEQDVVKKEAIDHFNKYGSTVISCYTGFGKTITAIYIASKIRLRTLILVNRIVLIKQWKSAILRFCPNARIQILTPKTNKKDADFYLMNASNVPKRGWDYEDVGLVIADECHLIMAEGLSRAMQFLVPRYVLGLSATPYRVDGLNKLLDLYFGERRIYRKLWKKHIVYKVNTGFKPTVELTPAGRVNWNTILESQAGDPARNELIVKITQMYPSRVFLILCKRVSQGRFLVDRLEEEGEDVTSLIGEQQEYEQSSRILVGTTGKCSTGFDHPRLDTLLLAGDIQEYYIQALGRVMRRRDVEPVVFDLVDDNGILKKHFRTRRAVYVEHGGVVKKFSCVKK